VQVRRAFKFRAYPTQPQEGRAVRLLADHCDLYNAALEERREAWRIRQVSVPYGMQSAPRPDPERPGTFLPNQAAAKAGLNKAILDAGWAQFTGILAAKAEEAGRRVILVNPACTSIDCHACGQRCIRPRRDTVICPRCGPHDADINGARNIYARAGLGSGQAATAA
jgi:Putative transposase DNA-binding domain/Helix-turn-helix domain